MLHSSVYNLCLDIKILKKPTSLEIENSFQKSPMLVPAVTLPHPSSHCSEEGRDHSHENIQSSCWPDLNNKPGIPSSEAPSHSPSQGSLSLATLGTLIHSLSFSLCREDDTALPFSSPPHMQIHCLQQELFHEFYSLHISREVGMSVAWTLEIMRLVLSQGHSLLAE